MKELNDSKKIKNLMSKVKALAERGEMGEKEAAKEKLNQLKKVYKKTKFEEDKYKRRTFKLLDYNDCKVLMIHCILDSATGVHIEGNEHRKELYCKLTDEQYSDTCAKFNYFYPKYYKQREAFLKAFILKNNIGIQEDYKESEDSDYLRKRGIVDIVDMMNTVKVCPYNRKLISN